MTIISVKQGTLYHALKHKWRLTYTVGLVALMAASFVLFDIYYLYQESYIHLRLSYKTSQFKNHAKQILVHAEVLNTGIEDVAVKDLLIRETADGINYTVLHNPAFTNKILKSKGLISWDVNLPAGNYSHEYAVELRTNKDDVFTSKPHRYR
jgi:hypothetical protein